jgi:hypothetical protein
MKVHTKLAALCFCWIMATAVQAGVILDTPILGGEILVATDGNVYAEFLGSDAGYFNTLYLDTPSDWGSSHIFDKSSPVNGDQIDLGVFSAGVELIFRIHVRNTGLDFFSGASPRNPDGLAHVEAITTLQNGIYYTTVGFEDLLGGGDKDYNDFIFRLTNVLDPLGSGQPVTEPPVLFLLVCGMITLIVQRRQRS